ncbi:unnamed protein product [Echinostoma caproni]|uniref:leucine--tRNA ligase n=1 Tax=Echinostoma caproni TaxID=27848 RepID=A0A183ADL1_9TREM|nr:unnamed protein product [Echinostoma caproni]
MFANDIKICCTIEGSENRSSLQKDLNTLAQWTETMALPGNTTNLSGTHLKYPAFISISRCYPHLSKTAVLESKWIKYIRQHDKEQNKQWDSDTLASKRSYILSMFPYPSGNLHLGHLRVYTVADVLARYKTMRGFAVMQPMGWDSFGLPAENAAIDRNILPSAWTSRNIDQMRQQMESTMLLNLNWFREISTCNPDYYKWTQWIFLKLFESGLAYRRSAFVNWDPVDQTVLADELVDSQGRSWRSGAVVERKPLRQWYFRSSVYSQSLVNGLKDIEGNQWRDVVQMQRGWLGNLEGTQIEFDLVVCGTNSVSSDLNNQEQTRAPPRPEERLTVFTKEPHLVVADLVSHIDVTMDSVYYTDSYRKSECERGVNASRKLLLFHGDSNEMENDSRKLNIVSTMAASPWPELLAISVLHPFTGRLIPMVRQPNVRLSLSVAFPDLIPLMMPRDMMIIIKSDKDETNLPWYKSAPSSKLIVVELNRAYPTIPSWYLFIFILSVVGLGGFLN